MTTQTNTDQLTNSGGSRVERGKGKEGKREEEEGTGRHGGHFNGRMWGPWQPQRRLQSGVRKVQVEHSVPTSLPVHQQSSQQPQESSTLTALESIEQEPLVSQQHVADRGFIYLRGL